MQRAAENIQRIEYIFREVQEQYDDELPLELLPEKLNHYELLFRSVAFEAASMCIALQELKNNKHSLKHWQQFASIAEAHGTQVNIGLGWALAQLEISPALLATPLPESALLKATDGYGYYEGMFRRRKSILQQSVPESFKEERWLQAYDTGLGRSVWYTHATSPDSIKNTIGKFNNIRQPNLWQGLGTAIAYVGGVDVALLHYLKNDSGPYAAYLLKGALNAQNSRAQAAAISSDTNQVVQTWM